MTAEPYGSGDPQPRTGRLLLAIVVVAAGVVAVWLVTRSGTSAVDRGVAAFAAGRIAEAEVWFTEAAGAGSDDPAVYLYLGRIHRRAGRYDQASTALLEAAELDPEDGDVRRELGYLFLDLGRPQSATEQFRRAQELDPTEPLAWIGLIRALRLTGSPEADVWLARAPDEVRAALQADPDGTGRDSTRAGR
jgi:tetratricopeptide (TPR) repeat protein